MTNYLPWAAAYVADASRLPASLKTDSVRWMQSVTQTTFTIRWHKKTRTIHLLDCLQQCYPYNVPKIVIKLGWKCGLMCSMCAPRAWDRLPMELRHLRSTPLFKHKLKTFLITAELQNWTVNWTDYVMCRRVSTVTSPIRWFFHVFLFVRLFVSSSVCLLAEMC